MDPEDFWASDSLVESYVSQVGALQYEVDVIRAAVERASATGPVGTVHVLGVGAGRELPAIRSAAPDATIHAWDISEPMVRACRRFVEAERLDRVVVGRSDTIELTRSEESGADVVIGLGAVLGYHTDAAGRADALASLAALSRPGAGIALVVQQRYGRPDWAAWFVANGVRSRLTRRRAGAGNRLSRHGSTAVRFHHYTRTELHDLLIGAGFGDVATRSLRQWARISGTRIPTRSPNPLIVDATYRPVEVSPPA